MGQGGGFDAAFGEGDGRFKIVLSGIRNAAVFGYRRDGTITFWNAGSEALYGYSAREIIGRDAVEWLHSPEARGRERCIMTS